MKKYKIDTYVYIWLVVLFLSVVIPATPHAENNKSAKSHWKQRLSASITTITTQELEPSKLYDDYYKENKPGRFAVYRGLSLNTSDTLFYYRNNRISHGFNFNPGLSIQAQGSDIPHASPGSLNLKLKYKFKSIREEAGEMLDKGYSYQDVADFIGDEWGWEYEEDYLGSEEDLNADIVEDVVNLLKARGASPGEIGLAVKRALLSSDASYAQAQEDGLAIVRYFKGSNEDLTTVRNAFSGSGFYFDRPITINPDHIKEMLKIKWSGGMTTIDPPSMDLDAGDDLPESIIGELSPYPFFGETIKYRNPQKKNTTPDDKLFLKGKLKRKGGEYTKQTGYGEKFKGIYISSDGKKGKDQWGLHRVGYLPEEIPESAWNHVDENSKNTIVAVIDSGFNFNHPDGPEFIWKNLEEIPDNGLDDDHNGYVDDIHGWNFMNENNDLHDTFGHGSLVTGIIAAKKNNKIGIAGINPGAQIMVLKVNSRKDKATNFRIYRAIRYAVDNGARVINISLGEKELSRLEQIAVNYAYAMGRLVVIASGNQSRDTVNYGPSGCRRAFSVAAININGRHRESSNRGLNVALAAPGEEIYSLSSSARKKLITINKASKADYNAMSGTSFSAPFVTGTVSLIWAKHPGLTNRQVEDVLLDTAIDIGEPGWDHYMGHGLLNASGALSSENLNPLTIRITEIHINKVKNKIASLDIYGVIRGNIKQYTLEIGKGKNPKKWETVFGPADTPVEFNHIMRIDGEKLKKGPKWTVRISAENKTGNKKTFTTVVETKK